jgi:hypothetical protein
VRSNPLAAQTGTRCRSACNQRGGADGVGRSLGSSGAVTPRAGRRSTRRPATCAAAGADHNCGESAAIISAKLLAARGLARLASCSAWAQGSGPWRARAERTVNAIPLASTPTSANRNRLRSERERASAYECATTAVPEMNLVDVVMKRRNAIFLLASTSHPSCFVVHTIEARRALRPRTPNWSDPGRQGKYPGSV